MEILIGRDPESSKLKACFPVDGKLKMITLDESSDGLLGVTRILPKEGKAHCKINRDDRGNMTITNLNDKNITKVDGVSIVSKSITADSRVTLGMHDYVLNLHKLIEDIVLTKGVDITHLKKVWSDYEAEMDRIAKIQIDRNRRRMLPMLLGTGSTLVSVVLGALAPGVATAIPICIAVISFGILFKIYREKDTSVEDKKKAVEKLEDTYVCPKCHKFLNTTKYSLLIQRHDQCPYCKVKFIHEA